MTSSGSSSLCNRLDCLDHLADKTYQDLKPTTVLVATRLSLLLLAVHTNP